MRIISKSALRKFWAIHPKAEVGLGYWYKITENCQWQHLDDIRKSFPSADGVGNFIIFNISGNTYRLITYIDFESKRVYIRSVLTHADYDKNIWKKDKWYLK